MAFQISSPNTGASLAAQAEASKIYDKVLRTFEQTSDHGEQFEGASTSALITTNTDLAKGAGMHMKIRTMAGLHDEPFEGDEIFEEEDDYESLVLNDFDLKVDFVRHATRYTQRSGMVMGLESQLKAGVPKQLGLKTGRTKWERMLMLMRERSSSNNQIIANGRTMATLKSTDNIVFDTVVSGATVLKSQGSSPATVRVGKHGHEKIMGYVVFATTDSLFSLETDSTYKSLLENAGDRGAGNLMFNGGFSLVRGNIISPFNPIDHDGEGAVGSPANPKAFCGLAIAAPSTGNETILLKGGRNATAAAKTKKKYFKWFPGYAYRMGFGDTLTPDAGPHYALAINPPTGANAGKIAMFKYTTGNDGNAITITQRLHSAILGGNCHTTVGSVTWDTGVWAGLHTNVVDLGATIIPCTERGVPFADAFVVGAGGVVRGYGSERNSIHTQTEQDFIYSVYSKSIFGQAVFEDAQGNKPGVLRLRHAIKYAGLNIPVVT